MKSLKKVSFGIRALKEVRGPFQKSPGKFLGSKSNIQIEI